MGRVWWNVAILSVLILMAGCVTRSSHTEGDREVNDQQKKAGQVVVESNQAAAQAIDSGELVKAKTLLEQGAIAGNEIVKNAKQQEGVHGAAEKPAPAFSPTYSDAARKKSTEDHASGNWIVPTLTVLGAIGSVAVTLAGMPWLAQLFPVLTGKIGKIAKAGVETINNVRAEAEANGGSIDVRTVLEIAKDKNVSAGVQGLITKYAHAHEDAMGHELTSLSTMKDADGQPDPELVAAPASAPAAAPAPISAT